MSRGPYPPSRPPGYPRRRAAPLPWWLWALALAAAVAIAVFGAQGLPPSPFVSRGAAPSPTAVPPSPSRPITPPASGGATATVAGPPIVFPPTPARATATPAVTTARDGTSEGVRLTGADRWQAAGFTGRGVRVGVIEWTFNETAQHLADARVTTHSFRPDGKTVVTDEAELPYGTLHGTATAVIVHEMAPDAELVLAVITRDPASFVAAVDWLTTEAKVNVISLSGGWYSGYAKDGTSPMARAVDRAKDAGVFVALSGGNKGGGDLGSNAEEGHYRAQFTDTDGDGYHDFATTESGPANGQTIRVGGGVLRLYVDWGGDRYPQASYSAELADATGRRVVWTDPARTADTDAPYQQLEQSVPRGTYSLRIKKEARDAPDLPVEIFFNGAQFTTVTPEGSLNLPADARGAVAVGPVNWDSGEIERYASQGPTRDGRAKPDLYGPDCTTSRVYSTYGGQFCGASAATPHVAGAAALIKGAFPDASPDDILAWLRRYGKPLPNSAVRIDLGPLPPPRS